jgi:HAE1 family hydrophobic/amphiphilic exporter-1
MGFSHFFIERPIFAGVIWVILSLIGAISFRALPITEYPEIVPPTVQVTATYPGASAEVLADTIASPIEQEINGVDNMIYMMSQSTGDGSLTINVVFKTGTDVDQAQVLVQNRVAVAIPRLPPQAQLFGVSVRKKTPDLMLVIHLLSPDGTLDQRYISNYATINVKDALARLDGVGDAVIFGARDYSMRIWLDPAKLQARGLSSADVLDALRAANVAVSAGAINQPPAASPGAFQISLATQSSKQTGTAASRASGTSQGWSWVRRTTTATHTSTIRSQPPSLCISGRAQTRSPPPSRSTR